MKKTLLLTIISAMFMVGAAYSQSQSLAFNDGVGDPTSGTYSQNGTFSFDVSLTFNGYSAPALDFWLETTTAFAGSLSITGVTYGTAFPLPQQTTPNPAPFNNSSEASPGYRAELRDLGSFTNGAPVPPGTYLVAHVTFMINAAPPGNYILQSGVTGFNTSMVIDDNFDPHNIPAAQYMIMIIPEPTTLALIGFTAVGGAVIGYRRRRLRG